MHLTRKTSVSLFVGAVVVLCSVELWVVTAPAFAPNSAVFAAIVTADLLLGIPLLFYALIVRPYHLSPTTVAAIVLLGFILARLILPPTGRQYLGIATTLIVLMGIAVLGVVVWKARRIARHYQRVRPQSIYFIDALEASIGAVVGTHPAIRLFTIEFVLIFLSVFGWFTTYRVQHARHAIFTYHRTSRYTFVFSVFLLLMILETIGLHLVIQHWSPRVAWALTSLSAYGILWVVGEFAALRLLPIVLADQTLHLRSGIRWSATVRLIDIVDVQRPTPRDARPPDYLSFARAGEARLVLVLRHPIRVHGLFGMGKHVSRIGLFVDDINAFRAELEQRRYADQ